MYTRLTGRAVNGSVLCCTRSTKRILASGLSTISPSTPAVRRPALRSVTRRTLKSVFERDRSINFCRLRTLARSPACDAVKIRCRNRRTLASAARQSTWCQVRVAPSGPFAATVIAASNLPSGSEAPVIFLFTGSPDRVSTLSGPGTMSRIRPVTRDGQPEGAGHSCPGFPLPFGCRHSLLGHQIPAKGLGLPHGRLTGRTAPDLDGGYRVSHARATTGVGASCVPRTTVLLPTERAPQPASAASLRPVPALRDHIPPAELTVTRHQPEVQVLHPSGLPLACSPRMERAPLGFCLMLRTPPGTPATHVRPRPGHRARARNYALDNRRTSNHVVHSMHATSRRTRDRSWPGASYRATRSPPPARPGARSRPRRRAPRTRTASRCTLPRPRRPADRQSQPPRRTRPRDPRESGHGGSRPSRCPAHRT